MVHIAFNCDLSPSLLPCVCIWLYYLTSNTPLQGCGTQGGESQTDRLYKTSPSLFLLEIKENKRKQQQCSLPHASGESSAFEERKELQKGRDSSGLGLENALWPCWSWLAGSGGCMPVFHRDMLCGHVGADWLRVGGCMPVFHRDTVCVHVCVGWCLTGGFLSPSGLQSNITES